jgi:hypothetical protein
MAALVQPAVAVVQLTAVPVQPTVAVVQQAVAAPATIGLLSAAEVLALLAAVRMRAAVQLAAAGRPMAAVVRVPVAGPVMTGRR